MPNVNDYFQKVAMSTATTMSAPGYTVGTTTINVGSTTNWVTETGITFGVDEIDANGERIAGTYNIFRGTVASATQLANVTYVGGDANRNYSAGATTRVYMLVSYARENRLVDGLLVSHDQDGTLKAGAVDNADVLADDVVTTAKILDASVTNAKLAITSDSATVNASETTTSLTYVDLPTTTDQVTIVVPASGKVLLSFSSQFSQNTTNQYCIVSYELSGANTRSPLDIDSIYFKVNASPAHDFYFGKTKVLKGLTPGATTFKLKYRVTGGTGSFAYRDISVVAL